MTIGASLQVHDSLLEGVSRFYAELRRLSGIRQLAASGPNLFLWTRSSTAPTPTTAASAPRASFVGCSTPALSVW